MYTMNRSLAIDDGSDEVQGKEDSDNEEESELISDVSVYNVDLSFVAQLLVNDLNTR